MRGAAAPGPDGLPPDLFKRAYLEIRLGTPASRSMQTFQDHVLLPYIHAVLAAAFSSCCYPPNWSTAAVTAVFKKGDARNLGNYRGIAVGSALGKLYSAVLTARLDRAAEQRLWRADGQAGFRRGRRTADHAFVLRHVIDAARARRDNLYCCFVDFKQAFDSVRRDLLVRKLAALGVTGRLLHAVVSMYYDVQIIPRLNGMLGEPFSSTCGVKQGDPLSPLLFGLFIDEFEGWLREHARASGTGVRIDDGPLLQVLLYADDMALLATSPGDLQRQLDALRLFCTERQLAVNVAKTEIVVFRPQRTTPPAHTWTYDGEAVPVVEQFKYLGVTFHAELGVCAAVKAFETAAAASMRALLHKSHALHMVAIDIRLHLFRALISPIMHYCCEVWGPQQLAFKLRPDGTPQRQMCTGPLTAADLLANNMQKHVHSVFLRLLGGLRLCTRREVLLREFGQRPIATFWLSASVQFLNRIIRMSDDHLPKRALLADLRLGSNARTACWSSEMLSLLSRLPLPAPIAPLDPDALAEVPLDSVQRAVEDVWLQPWQQLELDPRTAPEDGAQLCVYQRWVCDPLADDERRLRLPRYLFEATGIPTKHWCSLLKFRTSCHSLRRVVGGWTNTARAERVCRVCTSNSPEDELHLVFECPAFAQQRITARAEGLLFPDDHNLPAFLDQEPAPVAKFIHTCLTLHEQITTASTTNV